MSRNQKNLDCHLHRIVDSRIVSPCVNAGLAQLVARHLAKVEVAGSNPVARSIEFERSTSVGRFFVAVFTGLPGDSAGSDKRYLCDTECPSDFSHFKIELREYASALTPSPTGQTSAIGARLLDESDFKVGKVGPIGAFNLRVPLRAELFSAKSKFPLAWWRRFPYINPCVCGLSAVGSAPPCQGGGRGFEPRSPLHVSTEAGLPASFIWRSGQVVRQRPAKPLPPVRIRASPP